MVSKTRSLLDLTEDMAMELPLPSQTDRPQWPTSDGRQWQNVEQKAWKSGGSVVIFAASSVHIYVRIGLSFGHSNITERYRADGMHGSLLPANTKSE